MSVEVIRQGKAVRAHIQQHREACFRREWEADLVEDNSEEIYAQQRRSKKRCTFASRLLDALPSCTSNQPGNATHLRSSITPQPIEAVNQTAQEAVEIDLEAFQIINLYDPQDGLSALSACHVYHSWSSPGARYFQSDARRHVAVAIYTALPSFDHATLLHRSRATPTETFDYHPMFGYKRDRGWDKDERERLRRFWDAIAEDEIDSLDSKEEPLVRNPFADRVKFRTVQAVLAEYNIAPETLKEFSGVCEIEDDATLLTWLTNRFECDHSYQETWSWELAKIFDYLIESFQQKPIVEIFDDYRATTPEGKPRARINEELPGLIKGWSALCPIHLLYVCPYHEDFRPDKPDIWRPICAPRSHRAITRSIKSYRSGYSPCGTECWRNERSGDDIQLCEMPLEEVVAKWAPEHLQTFQIIAENAELFSPCDIAVLLPGVPCFQIEAVLRDLDMIRNVQVKIAIKKEQTSAKVRRDFPDSRDASLRVLEYRATRRMGRSSYALAKEKQPTTHFSAKLPNQTYGYVPCHHPGRSCKDAGSDCNCEINETFCDRYCDCSALCNRRFLGCYYSCHHQQGLNHPYNCSGDKCPCFVSGRECDPELCSGKKPTATNECANMKMQLRKGKKCLVAVSAVEGFGLYLAEKCEPGDLIQEYTGEQIHQGEGNRRAVAFAKRSKTYSYETDHSNGIDSEYFGNRTRYVNAPPSGAGPKKKEKANSGARVMYVLGEHRIGVYAERALEVGTEITMEYGPLYHFANPA